MLTAGKPFTREDLVSLKRSDIQRLCKDYGVRANMKTEALIELLLDSIRSNMSPLVGPRVPQQLSAPRRVSTRSSTRVSSLRSRGTSGSSSSTSLVASSSHPASSGSRTSKSKLTQYKLGVGRPSAGAGPGIRTTSRSSSASKTNRGKIGRPFKPPEATIAEEPEPSQTASIADQDPVPSSSRVNSSATDSNDVVTRIGRLETTLREADVKRQLDSLRHVSSQVAYLKASVQQREAEIMGLRGELNVCKAEILTLRSEVSKTAILEDQLRTLKDALEHLKTASSLNTNVKGKVTRHAPAPFAESNTNATTNNKTMIPGRCETVITRTAQTEETPVTPTKTQSGPSEIALGKRSREVNPANIAGFSHIPEDTVAPQEEPTRRALPDRKRARTGSERRPLPEKPIELTPESEKPAIDQEVGEDCVGSAGSSASGPSTQPSVSTPPQAPHGPEHFGDFSTQHSELRSEDLDMLDFCNAASSTPRDDMFNFFDQGETFSQLSATKLATRIAAHEPDRQQNSSPQRIQQEPRRISTAVARPRTPPRPSGPGRFRVSVDNLSPVREDIGSPFDPYEDGVFGVPFGAGLNAPANYARRDIPYQPQNQGLMPAPMPLALGFGLGTATGAMMQDDSPVRPAPRTMYGTELQNDNRFGDFGRDAVASSSNMEFWQF